MTKDLSGDLKFKALSVYEELKRLAFKLVGETSFIFPSDEMLNWKLPHPGPSLDETETILFTFQEEGIVKIIQEAGFIGKRGVPYRWWVEVIRPQFNDFEEKLLQNTDALIFSKKPEPIGRVTDKEIKNIIDSRRLTKREAALFKLLVINMDTPTLSKKYRSQGMSQDGLRQTKYRLELKIINTRFVVMSDRKGSSGQGRYWMTIKVTQ